MTSSVQTTLWGEDGGASTAERRFRPIHYLGSKLRLLDDITGAIDEIADGGDRVCDLFAGSGTVTAALAASRSVTAVDIQEYSRVLCSALLRQHPIARKLLEDAASSQSDLLSELLSALAPIIEYEHECVTSAVAGRPDALSELLDYGSIFAFHQIVLPVDCSRGFLRAMNGAYQRLAHRGLAQGPSSVMTRYYGGVYFSYIQAAHLDALLVAADSARRSDRDSILAVALSTASDVVNTVGKHFAQPVRLRKRSGALKGHLVEKVRREREVDAATVARRWADRYAAIPERRGDNRALRLDFAEFLQTDARTHRVIYADPPYTRDHYSRYYHVLETMARRDEPQLTGSNLERLRVSRGLYRAERYQSPFCIKSRAPAAFAALFAQCRRLRTPLVLSYSPYEKTGHPRMMTVDQLRDLGREYFASVDVRSVGTFAHSKLNSSDLALTAAKEAEVLFVCR